MKLTLEPYKIADLQHVIHLPERHLGHVWNLVILIYSRVLFLIIPRGKWGGVWPFGFFFDKRVFTSYSLSINNSPLLNFKWALAEVTVWPFHHSSEWAWMISPLNVSSSSDNKHTLRIRSLADKVFILVQALFTRRTGQGHQEKQCEGESERA